MYLKKIFFRKMYVLFKKKLCLFTLNIIMISLISCKLILI